MADEKQLEHDLWVARDALRLMHAELRKNRAEAETLKEALRREAEKGAQERAAGRVEALEALIKSINEAPFLAGFPAPTVEQAKAGAEGFSYGVQAVVDRIVHFAERAGFNVRREREVTTAFQKRPTNIH